MLNDLKSAFDNVPHDILFNEKLPAFGVEPELINTISWLYRQTVISSGDFKIKIGKGGIQGGVLSPTLFIITIDDLIEVFESKQKVPFVFADDLSTV